MVNAKQIGKINRRRRDKGRKQGANIIRNMANNVVYKDRHKAKGKK